MDALPLTVNDLRNTEMEYCGKFGHTLVRIHHISLMIIIEISYIACRLATQTVTPTIIGFQGIK